MTAFEPRKLTLFHLSHNHCPSIFNTFSHCSVDYLRTVADEGGDRDRALLRRPDQRRRRRPDPEKRVRKRAGKTSVCFERQRDVFANDLRFRNRSQPMRRRRGEFKTQPETLV